MSELFWMQLGKGFLGLREIPGEDNNPTIINMLEHMGKFNGENRAWWKEDETPWCGLFVGYVLGMSNRYVQPNWFRALDWDSETMTELKRPAYGALATFKRAGGGHVGFIAGKTRNGNLLILGGNQSNQVSIMEMKDEPRGIYWPSKVSRDEKPVKSTPLEFRYSLRVLDKYEYQGSMI